MTNSPKNLSKVTPKSCLMGSLISGVLAFLLYRLTSSIAQTFAHKPITVTQQWAIQIASAVRTLVVGMSSLATGLFVLTTVGLILLAIQLVIQKMKPIQSSSTSK
jgi:uncharacterized membrane protein (DUF373 family)